jgi:hypothetical protein
VILLTDMRTNCSDTGFGNKMNPTKTLRRIKAATFHARGTSGSIYAVECIENVLEERDGARVVHTPKAPEFRLVDSHRPVNWNPKNDTFSIVGTGEVLRRETLE